MKRDEQQSATVGAVVVGGVVDVFVVDVVEFDVFFVDLDIVATANMDVLHERSGARERDVFYQRRMFVDVALGDGGEQVEIGVVEDVEGVAGVVYVAGVVDVAGVVERIWSRTLQLVLPALVEIRYEFRIRLIDFPLLNFRMWYSFSLAFL